MTRWLAIVSLCFCALPAFALRVMTDDRVIASQERRFMEGSDWMLPLIGLIWFIGLGLIQFGIPHLITRIIARRRPQLKRWQRLLILLGGITTIWLLQAQFTFTRRGALLEHLGYLLFALMGYLYIYLPAALPGWLQRHKPQIRKTQRVALAFALFGVFTLTAWLLLRLVTEGGL